jgi:hypothetical protein
LEKPPSVHLSPLSPYRLPSQIRGKSLRLDNFILVTRATVQFLPNHTTVYGGEEINDRMYKIKATQMFVDETDDDIYAR